MSLDVALPSIVSCMTGERGSLTGARLLYLCGVSSWVLA